MSKNSLTTLDVFAAYRTILDRDPENTEVLHQQLGQASTMKELRRRLLQSPEFLKNNWRDCIGPVAHSQVTRRRQSVQLDCDPEQLEAMFDHVSRIWNKLGTQDPFYSVLSEPNFRSENFDANKSSYEEKGEKEVDRLFRELNTAGEINRDSEVVELGCGTGRVTIPLAKRFRTVTGLDVSRPHLDLALEYCEKEKLSNITLMEIQSVSDLKIPPFDLFYSQIVLQHNPPPIAAYIVGEIFASARPGAYIVMQAVTHINDYVFDPAQYLKQAGSIDDQELHPVPLEYIIRRAYENGLRALNVYRDGNISDHNITSTKFIFRREG